MIICRIGFMSLLSRRRLKSGGRDLRGQSALSISGRWCGTRPGDEADGRYSARLGNGSGGR